MTRSVYSLEGASESGDTYEQVDEHQLGEISNEINSSTCWRKSVVFVGRLSNYVSI
jgi:hypothetical protein